MATIAHVSDIHCGRTGFKPKLLAACIKEINKLKPDAVVVTGDLTISGYKENYQLAKKYLSKLKSKTLVIPGNHDSRLRGYEYFDEFFGHGNTFLDLPGISIIGIDTTIPDLDEGNVGRGKLRWLVSELKKRPETNLKIVAMHHHLVSIPHTGRERSTVSDAGDVLNALVDAGVDLILCGHKHTPHSWLVNSVAIVNAGSISAVKLRAYINNSYNIIRIEKDSIEVFLKEIGKKPEHMVKYFTSSSKEGLVVKR